MVAGAGGGGVGEEECGIGRWGGSDGDPPSQPPPHQFPLPLTYIDSVPQNLKKAVTL